VDKGKLVRLVLIPIIIGLVVTLIVRQVLNPSQSSPTTGGSAVEMVAVVAVGSKEPIAARSKISEQQLVLKQVPRSILTGSEFTATKDLLGQVTQVQLEPGEVILKSRVVIEGKGALPYRIPQGYRAVTIRIDELSGVAGHPQAGDLVDLVLTVPEKKPDRLGATARLIYEGVQVLGKGLAVEAAASAAGGVAAAANEGTKLTSLTLALRPEAAVEVALAEEIGHIKVLLRPALPEGNSGRIKFSEDSYKQ